MGTSDETTTDGRIQRSERSREAIVVAMLELIGEGVMSPTAQQVAERAHVGVRTVFRHFSDMDSLFTVMNERLIKRVRSFFVEDVQTGPLSKRVELFVERRFAAFESLSPYLRCSALQRARSSFLQSEHESTIKIFRRDLQRSVPEVGSAPSEIGDGLEMALSFEAYNRLRLDQRLSSKRTLAAIRATVLGLTSRLETERQ
jgi:AcrR family transcriptional regulator